MTSLMSLMPASTALNEDEFRLRAIGDDAGERRLARAGRAPEDQRLQRVVLDRQAQRRVRPHQRLLSDDVVQRPWAHALGQRRRCRWAGSV